MNPVLILTHNGIALTQRCVESVRKQDIDCFIWLIDNDSTDGTREWAYKEIGGGWMEEFTPQLGVSGGWNEGLHRLFGMGADHVLVIGNDTVLPPWFYRELLSYKVPFVSGIDVNNMEQISSLPERSELVPHPSFSAFCISRDCWNKIGCFDSSMVSWASDCDFHVRAHRMGINLLAANVPFYHIKSRTIELANPKEKRAFEMQADADRMRFFEKWKAHVWSPQYAELFSPYAFGIDLD